MIDLNDFKIVEAKVKDGVRLNKLYKCYCDSCKRDRGYQAKGYKNPLCTFCSNKNKGKDTEESKLKKSIAAFNRYNSNANISIDLSTFNTKQINGRTCYEDSCSTCDKNKGFVAKQYIGLNCRSCAISIAKRGKVSPKKGIKTGLPAWNKGKKTTCPIMKKLHHTTAVGIRKGIKDKNRESTVKILGYSFYQLKQHLESLFQPGMSWNNYGNYDKNRLTWHIDHIIPKSWFTFNSKKDEEFKKCWELSNLQPLWAIDNLKKSNRFIG